MERGKGKFSLEKCVGEERNNVMLRKNVMVEIYFLKNINEGRVEMKNLSLTPPLCPSTKLNFSSMFAQGVESRKQGKNIPWKLFLSNFYPGMYTGIG